LKSEEINRYYANGKLLISGEYLVLSGAEALAVPVKMGQRLEVRAGGPDSPFIQWEARVMDKLWFSATILLPDMKVEQSSDPHIASRLVKILLEIRKMNDTMFTSEKSYSITTISAFDHAWGMGSSSALIANLARWASVDPFDLFHRLYEGSGYDLAAALAGGPILFSTVNHKSRIIPVTFRPSFHQKLWFVYRGHKQDTKQGLEELSGLPEPTRQQIEMMNYFTGEMLHTKHLHQFMHIMSEHESFISQMIGKRTVKEELFSDFSGEIKSLGAWGGDFMMAASDRSGEYIHTYFQTKGIQTVFDFHSLILS